MKKAINKSELLELLNSKMTYPLFKEGKTVLSIKELSFYNEYVFIKAKTFSTIPTVEFSFLWNKKDNNIIKIDGSRGCFFDNIELLQPHITPQTAVAYVKFILGCVWDEIGAMRVCESIEDVEFSASPFPNQLTFLSDNIKLAKVCESGDMIIVNCNIVYGKSSIKPQ